MFYTSRCRICVRISTNFSAKINFVLDVHSCLTALRATEKFHTRSDHFDWNHGWAIEPTYLTYMLWCGIVLFFPVCVCSCCFCVWSANPLECNPCKHWHKITVPPNYVYKTLRTINDWNLDLAQLIGVQSMISGEDWCSVFSNPYYVLSTLLGYTWSTSQWLLMIERPGTPNNQLKMDLWWFPTISYVKVGNHPIETTIHKWLVLGFQGCITFSSQNV